MTEIQFLCSLGAIILGGYCLIITIAKMRADIDPVPDREMSKWQQAAVDKLEKSDFSKFEDKLWDNTCPLCGKDMKLHTYGGYDQFSDHWCTHCNFITKCRVLC